MCIYILVILHVLVFLSLTLSLYICIYVYIPYIWIGIHYGIKSFLITLYIYMCVCVNIYIYMYIYIYIYIYISDTARSCVPLFYILSICIYTIYIMNTIYVPNIWIWIHLAAKFLCLPYIYIPLHSCDFRDYHKKFN